MQWDPEGRFRSRREGKIKSDCVGSVFHQAEQFELCPAATAVTVLVALVDCALMWVKLWATCFTSCSFTLAHHGRKGCSVHRGVKERSSGTSKRVVGSPWLWTAKPELFLGTPAVGFGGGGSGATCGWCRWAGGGWGAWTWVQALEWRVKGI